MLDLSKVFMLENVFVHLTVKLPFNHNSLILLNISPFGNMNVS